MMLTWVKPFVVVNGFVYGLALATCRAESWVGAWGSCLCRDVVIVLFLTWMTASKQRIRGPKKATCTTLEPWVRLAAIAAPVDAGVAILARYLDLRSDEVSPTFGPLGFLYVSFGFEVIFDLFHYWTHRACHSHPWLVKYHAVHHRHHAGLEPASTYDQAALDVFVCNALPAMAALGVIVRAVGPLSRRDWSLLWTYKSYVEVAGHAGVHSRATSFPQCVWLPRVLGIALRTVDHDLHHSSRGRSGNYAKRFTLWDKLFGTYLPPVEEETREMKWEMK
ncbi:hypothetical protein CTAYLR_006890 [Chrysophaeum taylorii]|uniref:Fatty acid hydroxylase domain-containing protein n=1 Tax=Chrysophaeum taylorii TaxID=2483200 RepID=A0AAD7XMZ9_9STRA|nr:hypothetical protein CTAYLR_006890 [Chrysophaeum taylorii]